MRLRNRISIVALLATAFVMSGCGGGGSDTPELPPPPTQPPPAPPPPPPPEPAFDTAAMLTNLSANVIQRNYGALAEDSRNFAAADGPIAALCTGVGGESEAAMLATAQAQWRELSRAAQATELHVIGPALANGEALRLRVTSFSGGPNSTCGIDQSAALVHMEDPDFNIASRSLNQRGIGAIEYLLFNEDLTHTCASVVPATQGWNELEESVRRRARCDLAQLIASDIAEAADLLNSRWGDYSSEFVAEGNVGATLQLVTDALFAIDTHVKDEKLGIPTGIHDDCSSHSCPATVESRFSRNSLANVRANVQSFLDMFQGLEGSGFDDLIEDDGFPEVSARFVANSQAVMAAIDVAPNSLYDEVLAIDNDTAETACTNAFAQPDGGDPADGSQSCRITGLLKRVTDDLKIDFVTIVEVEIPGSAQTDND